MTEARIIAGSLVDVRKIGRPPVPLRTRFERKYIPDPNSGCWMWIGTVDGRGYGAIKDGKKMRRATRVSWELYRGAFDTNLRLLHKCDNPLCVNPDHLLLGTNWDNTRDMFAKGRAHDRRGNNAKLTPEQVVEIRTSALTGRALAAKFGVSTATISFVRSGKRWSHV